MSVAETLFCYTSNEIDSHFCPDCRAPMLVRPQSADRELSARTFECFNCARVVVITNNGWGLHRANSSGNIGVPAPEIQWRRQDCHSFDRRPKKCGVDACGVTPLRVQSRSNKK
jgi:hypothetical protein